MRSRTKSAPTIAVILAFTIVGIASHPAVAFTVQLDWQGKHFEGKPLSWSKQRALLLTRDGSLLDFAPSQAKNITKSPARFYGFSAAEMRGHLHREFGRRFDVSGTSHYLVVHPQGQRDVWAKQFEDLYRSFVHYFTTRGLQPTPPAFPLIAIVCHKQTDFVRLASRDGIRLNPGLLGFYSPATNRVLLYDVTAGQADTSNWHVNAATTIHEAVHQLAFNTGIHVRFGLVPKWIVEGLATMFEAPGVGNPSHYPHLSDRIHRDRLKSFLNSTSSRRHKNALPHIIASDKLFEHDPEAAYAEAWALTFFLSELQPNRYAQYLKKTASRKPFSAYSSANRQKDFTDVFGSNWKLLDAKMNRFIKNLRVFIKHQS